MSGPKVIRVVTKEELQAICRRQLARVDAAAAEFLRRVPEQSRHNAQQEVLRRRQELSSLIDAGRFSGMQRQVPTHLEFYRSEVARIEREAIAAAERQRKARRHLADAAQSLSVAFATAGQSAPEGLAEVQRTALGASDKQLGEMQRMVDDAFRRLASSQPVAKQLDNQLAQRLAAGTRPSSLAEWLAAQPSEQASPNKLEDVLAELEVVAAPKLVEQFLVRASQAISEISGERRALLQDSLVLDASRAIHAARATASTNQRAARLIEELAVAGGQAGAELRGRIEASLRAGVAAEAELVEAEQLLELEAKRLSAEARRHAILRGLADLGYEVREGMATALARDGRIVLSRPGATDYGVEIGAPPDAGRLQVRVVGSDHPASPRSKDRDRQAEEQWCGDVHTLTASLAKSGTDILIERAAEVGAVPVKSVAEIGRNETDDATKQVPLDRMLR